VELPSRYPRLSGNGSLLARLRRMEDECLGRAASWLRGSWRGTPEIFTPDRELFPVERSLVRFTGVVSGAGYGGRPAG